MAIHQPRLAEIVAASLRDRILSGDLPPNSELPRQELLMEQFGVGKPALREALRVLEAEGLLTIRRGNQGGATVHAPHERNAAYAVGMILQSRNVTVRDLRNAVTGIEPVCVGLCAAREDRHEVVLPVLRAAQARIVESLDDEYLFTETSREFHELMVKNCGNETLIAIAGSLVTLWSTQELAWARDATDTGEFPSRAEREKGVKAHDNLLDFIEAGSVDDAQRQARRHLAASRLYQLGSGTDRVVELSFSRRG